MSAVHLWGRARWWRCPVGPVLSRASFLPACRHAPARRNTAVIWDDEGRVLACLLARPVVTSLAPSSHRVSAHTHASTMAEAKAVRAARGARARGAAAHVLAAKLNRRCPAACCTSVLAPRRRARGPPACSTAARRRAARSNVRALSAVRRSCARRRGGAPRFRDRELSEAKAPVNWAGAAFLPPPPRRLTHVRRRAQASLCAAARRARSAPR
jgi:hypothetical protein